MVSPELSKQLGMVSPELSELSKQLGMVSPELSVAPNADDEFGSRVLGVVVW